VELTVNGITRPVRDRMSVAELVAQEVASTRGIAVAVDRVVIPRSAWATTLLAPGARVEIVAAASGG
jgi:sulfur carrier protein